MGATLDPHLHVFPSNHLKYLQVGLSSYKQNQIRVIHKVNKIRKPTKPENKKNKNKKGKKNENQLLLTTSY